MAWKNFGANGVQISDDVPAKYRINGGSQGFVEFPSIYDLEQYLKSYIQTHSGDNTRNDQSSIVDLGGGELLMAYTHYSSTPGDGDPANIRIKKSVNGGVTFTDLSQIPNFETNGIYIPSLYRKDNGDILIIFFGQFGSASSRIWQSVSTNEGLTWSTPSITYQDDSSYFTVASDRIFKTSTGRLIYNVQKNTNGLLTSFNGDYRGETIYSDDEGSTWTHSTSYVISPDGLSVENGYYQIGDEIVQYYRSRSGSVFASKSTDDGVTWGTSYDLGLRAPNSQTTIIQSKEKDILIASNNRMIEGISVHGVEQRHFLDVSVSSDLGVTWNKFLTIEGDTNKTFIEPTILEYENKYIIQYAEGDDLESYYDLKQLILPKSYIYPLAASTQDLQKTLTGGNKSTLGAVFGDNIGVGTGVGAIVSDYSGDAKVMEIKDDNVASFKVNSNGVTTGEFYGALTDFGIYGKLAKDFLVWTNNLERLRILSNGNAVFSGSITAISDAGTSNAVTVNSQLTGFASTAYADAKVADNLTASTTVAPSKTAVNTALALKADLANPTFTGNVIVPNQSSSDNSTKAANTNYVTSAVFALGTTIPVILSGNATLDFPSLAAGATSSLSFTVTGAVVGDVVSMGIPVYLGDQVQMYAAVVTNDNVRIVLINNSTSAVDLASMVIKVKVFK